MGRGGRYRVCAAIALAWLPLPLTAAPADNFWDRVQVHGFASQAVVYTTNNRWFGDSTSGSLDFTELGLNGSLRATPGLLVSAQVLSRRAGDMYDGAPALDYGLIDWTPVANPRWRAGIRVGRLKNPIGLYNETRDVPFTRPSIFMPQVVYFDRVRNLVLSTDGAMVYVDHSLPTGRLSLTLGTGRAVTDTNVEWVYFDEDYPGRFAPRTNAWLWRLWYTSNNERWQLGLSGAAMQLGFTPNRAAPLTLAPGFLDMIYGVASVQYNAERWSISSEFALEPIRWRDLGPLQPDREAMAETWYIAGTWRLRPRLEWMLRLEQGVADRADRSGNRAAGLAGGWFDGSALRTRTLTTGLRWDINNNWMLRAEYSYQDGTFILSTRENQDLGDQVGHWNLFALLLAVRF